MELRYERDLSRLPFASNPFDSNFIILSHLSYVSSPSIRECSPLTPRCGDARMTVFILSVFYELMRLRQSSYDRGIKSTLRAQRVLRREMGSTSTSQARRSISPEVVGDESIIFGMYVRTVRRYPQIVLILLGR